jgi:hypothetical protein
VRVCACGSDTMGTDNGNNGTDNGNNGTDNGSKGTDNGDRGYGYSQWGEAYHRVRHDPLRRCEDQPPCEQTNKHKQSNECATRPATPPKRNSRPAQKRGSNAAMTSMPKRHSGISADTGQGGLTVHRQLDARRHDRDAHLPNQTPHARLACVRASVWVCRCARRIVLHAMAAAAAQFKCAHLDVHNDAHTRAQRQAGPMRTVPSRSFITDAFVSISRLRAAAASSDALRATSALACSRAIRCSRVRRRCRR